MNIAGVAFMVFVAAVVAGLGWGCALLDRREERLWDEMASRERFGLAAIDVIVSPSGVEIPVGSWSPREIVAALEEIDRLTGVAA